MKFMLKALRGMKTRGNSRSSINCRFAFQLGCTQNTRNMKGFTQPHNFRPGKAVHAKRLEDKDPQKMTIQKGLLYFAANKLIETLAPAWAGSKEVLWAAHATASAAAAVLIVDTRWLRLQTR